MPENNQRQSLTATERVEEYIRQAIYRGELKPRERVIEDDVAKQLGCSRGPVREALLRLERDGLIVTVGRRGTFIQDISAESIEVIFSMRGKLEALCVRYLRERLTPEIETTLREALKAMKTASRMDEESFLAADMSFHQTIWKLSYRSTLENSLSKIMNPFIFMVARAYSSQTPMAIRYKEHAEYLETILTDPIAKVERSVEKYFSTKAEAVLSQLRPPFLAVDHGSFPPVSRSNAGRSNSSKRNS